MTLWYGRSQVSKNVSEGRGDKPGRACGCPMCGDRMYARSAFEIGHTLTLRHDQRSEFHATVPATRGRQDRLQRSCDHGELPGPTCGARTRDARFPGAKKPRACAAGSGLWLLRRAFNSETDCSRSELGTTGEAAARPNFIVGVGLKGVNAPK